MAEQVSEPAAPMPSEPVPQWRLKLVALLLIVVGLLIAVFILGSARSAVELAYLAVTGLILVFIAASLAWRAWRPK